MTDIIILTQGDGRRARDIAELFEGGNRVRVLGIYEAFSPQLDPALDLQQAWLVIESGDGAEPAVAEVFGDRTVTIAPNRTAPEAAVDIIAAIRGAASPGNDPDAAWARTLGIKYDPARIAGNSPGDLVPPPIPLTNPQIPGAPEPTQFRGTAPRTPSDEPMPPTYLVWSVIMTVLCCMPAGIVAIVFSSMVSSKYYAGDIEAARRCSRRAEIWIIVAFVVGVLWNTLYLPLMMASWGN